MTKVITRFIVSAILFLGLLTLFPLISPAANSAGTNIVPNPSLETSANGSTPDSWVSEKSGTNTTTFTYLTTGHTGSRSVKTQITAYTNGDSHYKFNAQSVTANTKYDFSFWYQSNVATEVDMEVTSTSGNISYVYVGNVPASTAWKQYTATVTMPASASKASVYATIFKVGYITTDDYSLSSQATNPTAATPTFSPVAGTYTSAQSVTISDTTTGAKIYYTTNGNTPTTSSTLYSTPISVTATTTIKAIAVATGYTNSAVATALYTINITNPTAATPTFSPVAGTYTSAQNVTISDTTSGAKIYYTTNGNTPTTSSTLYSTPIAVSATTTIKAIAVATGYNNSAVASALYTINITLPTAATPTFSPVAGTYTSAQNVTISDTTTGAKIYYTTNGNTPTTSSTLYSTPIAVSATTTIKAIAVATGYTNSAVATALYTINITPPPAGNLINNPSFETANGTQPANWTTNKSGSGTTVTFSYLTTGHTGSRSVKVNVTKMGSGGDAYYKFNPVAVTPGTKYDFSFYYQSGVQTENYAEFLLSNGDYTYQYLDYAWPTSTWNKFSETFTAPANAVSVSVYAAVVTTGSITTDDYYLGVHPTPTPLNRAIVTLTYDEMNEHVYTYGLPLFTKYNMKGTFYFMSCELNNTCPDPDPGETMMNSTELNAYRTFGFEIGDHTITHPELPQISATQLDSELKDSQTALSNYFGGLPITDFASPYGEYDDNVVAAIQKYYSSHRTTDIGFNTKDNFDPYRLKAWSIEADMDVNYVKALIDQAIAEKTWVILVYHDIAPSSDYASDFLWNTTPENMDATLAYLQSKGVAVETTSQALAEVKGQINLPQ